MISSVQHQSASSEPVSLAETTVPPESILNTARSPDVDSSLIRGIVIDASSADASILPLLATVRSHSSLRKNLDSDRGIQTIERSCPSSLENAQEEAILSKEADQASAHSRHDSRIAHSSWRAPAIMLSGLLLGLTLAISHHEMNTHLNRQAIDSLKVGLSQQWVSRYGTALAFLVKASFVTCIGTAFVQRQWLGFSTHRQAVTVQEVDTISNALENLFSSFSAVWRRHPVLGVTALISWTTPIAAVVAPGSLSVNSIPFSSSIYQSLTYPAFEDFDRYMDFKSWDELGRIETTLVSKIAFATATSARILTAPPLYPNLTYTSVFTGPALKCSNANATLTGELSRLTANSPRNPEAILYFSWTGPSMDPRNADATYGPLDCGLSPELGCNIFVMSCLGIAPYFNVTNEQDFEYIMNNITECRLHNATYTVDIALENNIQTTTVSNIEYLAPIAVNRSEPMPESPTSSEKVAFSYASIMSAFGSLLVGTSQTAEDYDMRLQTHYDILGIDWTRMETMTSGLEELFQNITLSILASPDLSIESTERYPLNMTKWSSAYIYDPFPLLLSYGIAFVMSLACFVVGMHAFCSNHASFQNTFSTFVRAANNTNLEESIRRRDIGADPLPQTLGQTVFRMGTSPGTLAA